jgi:hypothetical protein
MGAHLTIGRAHRDMARYAAREAADPTVALHKPAAQHACGGTAGSPDGYPRQTPEGMVHQRCSATRKGILKGSRPDEVEATVQ